jgi:hypothetical protein
VVAAAEEASRGVRVSRGRSVLAKQIPEPLTRGPAMGARRLLAAVLERAVDDAIGPRKPGAARCTPAEQRAVLDWFAAESMAPGTFRWICALLEIDAGSVRGAIDRARGEAA